MSGPIRFGPLTSRISSWLADSVIWWLLWTGSAVMFWPGGSATHWMRLFAWNVSKKPCASGDRRSSITIRAHRFTIDRFYAEAVGRKNSDRMDGRGRVFDNIFIERLWRTVKYGNIYIQEYLTMSAAHNGLGKYFNVYNTERLHQSLDYQTPWEVYSGIKFCPPARESSLILPAGFSDVSQAGSP